MSLILPAAGTNLFPGLASEAGLSLVILHPLQTGLLLHSFFFCLDIVNVIF